MSLVGRAAAWVRPAAAYRALWLDCKPRCARLSARRLAIGGFLASPLLAPLTVVDPVVLYPSAASLQLAWFLLVYWRQTSQVCRFRAPRPQARVNLTPREPFLPEIRLETYLVREPP